MKRSHVRSEWLLFLLLVLFLSSCAISKKNDETSSFKEAFRSVLVGSVIGAGVGYLSTGDASGATAGAAAGAVLGLVTFGGKVLIANNERNKKQIQESLVKDHPTQFQDTDTKENIRVIPGYKYINQEGLSCIDFGIHNLDSDLTAVGNSACKINEEYEFKISANGLLVEPDYVTPFPIPNPPTDPHPKPSFN